MLYSKILSQFTHLALKVLAAVCQPMQRSGLSGDLCKKTLLHVPGLPLGVLRGQVQRCQLLLEPAASAATCMLRGQVQCCQLLLEPAASAATWINFVPRLFRVPVCTWIGR